ncbi:MAG TPA: hypothetical protein VGQ76_21585 [Thermoanaerobaculia bacterium]|jgi:hypothetical protein|nr:hypothetical protein [Thermoanaerobaculia bacterium]
MSRRLVLVAVLLFASFAHARDRAVLVYPKEQSFFRRIFYTSHQRALRERLSARYDLDVHVQVATDDEIFAIDMRGAKLLMLSGHGDPFAMHFAGRKSRTLDSSDRPRLEALFDTLDPHATIVLQSCHTGRGFAYLVKDAAGPMRSVIAASGEVPWNGMQITSVTPFDATLRCKDGSRRFDCTVRLY